MNNFLIDLLPVLLFFIVFKYQGIYAATWVGIFTTFLQVCCYRWWHKRWDKTQLVTLSIFLVFGGMTLYFHNPIFVKWKPTIIFWIFGVVLLGSHFIGTKPMVQRLLEGALKKQQQEAIDIPAHVGVTLNVAWTLFLMIMGAVNLYVAYSFNDNIWVNFKLYGISAATLVFSLLQSAFLLRYTRIK